MKKRIFALLLALTALLCVPAAAFEMEELAATSYSTDLADLIVKGNARGNYVNGNGSNSSPAETFLYANEKGGVTLVQYAGKSTGLAVTEFDGDFNFLNCRTLPLPDLDKWGGFCAGEEYNYVLYARKAGARYKDHGMHLIQYDKDWNVVQSEYLGMTRSGGTVFHNDVDMVEANGRLYIISNHVFGEGSHWGHQANMMLEITTTPPMTFPVDNSYFHDYDGYTSHSFRPEIVASGSKLYTFDRSDSVPGPYLLKTVFDRSLGSGTMSVIQRMAFRDWGSAGNAVAAGDEGALLAYTYAPNPVDDSVPSTATNVYLHYTSPAGSNTVQVTTTGGAGTPLVGAVNENSGFVLWNPDIRCYDEPEDTLYYAAYAVNGGNVTVGRPLTAEGHYLSDCDPISFDGGLLWVTVEGTHVIFHLLKPNAAPTTKIIHTALEVIEGVAPTCSQTGWTEGLKCRYCDAIAREPESIPTLPHTEEAVEALEPTCAAEGHTAGTGCAVCGAVISGQAVIEKLPHTREILPEKTATCLESGLTEGEWCTVCEEVLLPQQTVPILDHVEVETPALSPDYGRPGHTDGVRCGSCGGWLSGGEEIPAWCFHFHQISLYPYGENGMEYIINVTNDGDVPFWYVVNIYDNEGKLLRVLMFEGDFEDMWCRFPYLQDVGKIEAFALTKDLRPMGEKFVKTYAYYTGP